MAKEKEKIDNRLQKNRKQSFIQSFFGSGLELIDTFIIIKNNDDQVLNNENKNRYKLTLYNPQNGCYEICKKKFLLIHNCIISRKKN